MKKSILILVPVILCTLLNYESKAQNCTTTANLQASALAVGPLSAPLTISSCANPTVTAEWFVQGQVDYVTSEHFPELIVALPAQFIGTSGTVTVSSSNGNIYWNEGSISITTNEIRVPLIGTIPSTTTITILVEDMDVNPIAGGFLVSQAISNESSDCNPSDNSNSITIFMSQADPPLISDIEAACSETDLNIILTASSGTTNGGAITSYSWTGPNGFTTTEQNPSFTVPQTDVELYRGQYSVTVTDANFCETTDVISLDEINCLALPIELLRFDAIPGQNKVLLEWETATELNNSHFDIERSVDGRHYQKIGEVAGQGTTSEVVDYAFTDETPLSGKSFYRLKQVDYDGTYEYSHVEEVNRNSDSALKLFPNPVAAGTEFRVAGRQIQKVQVFNLLGQLVLEESYDRPQDQVFLSTDQLTQGMYITRINDTTEKRMIIK